MKRRGFLAALAALVAWRPSKVARGGQITFPEPVTVAAARFAGDFTFQPMGLDAWLPGETADATVTMPGGFTHKGKRLHDGWVRVADKWAPLGYVDMIQDGKGVLVRW